MVDDSSKRFDFNRTVANNLTSLLSLSAMKHVTLKTVFIGDSAVGKTCIVKRAASGVFESGKPTIGAANVQIDKEVENRIITFNIWDTAGEEKFRSLVPIYFQDASIIILVFDLTNRESFEHLSDWYRIAYERAPNAIFILLGNKSDLSENRAVSMESAIDYSHEIGASNYYEVSAKTGIMIDDCFEALAVQCDLIPESDVGYVPPAPQEKKSSCC